MIYGYVLAKQRFVLFQTSRWENVVMSCPPDLIIMLVCRQVYVECRLLPFSLRIFCFLGSSKTTNQIIRTLQPPQQAALRSVEVNVKEMYHIALGDLAGLRLVRVRHATKIPRKLICKYETSIRL